MQKQSKPEDKAKRWQQRIVEYSIVGGVLAGLWLYQPYEIDFVPKKSPDGDFRPTQSQVDLFNPANRVLVITAHPDDSELLIGGTLSLLAQHKVETHQVICTDGDKGYYMIVNAPENKVVRHEEAWAAAQKWHGQSLTFLGHFDGRLRKVANLDDELEKEIRRVRPTHILCFDGPCSSPKSHTDHRYSGEAAERAAIRVPGVKWMVRFQTNGINYGVDISKAWEMKKDLLATHKSQWTGRGLERITSMAENMAIEEGEQFDGVMTEGFRCSPPHGG